MESKVLLNVGGKNKSDGRVGVGCSLLNIRSGDGGLNI